MKIHECSELPLVTDITQDEDCLDLVVATFAVLNWRGDGQYGVVLETVTSYGTPSRPQRLIIKIGAVNADELRVACELNSLLGETPVFPHAYGWLACHAIPERWLRIIQLKNRNHQIIVNPPRMFMFTFVQPVEETWDNFTFIFENGYRVALFFLLHGLYTANRLIGFRHGDLHGGNIMIQQDVSMRQVATPTILRYGQYEAEVTSRFVPRIIDYGRSSTTKHTNNQGSNDLRQLRKMFDERLDLDGDDRDSEARPEMIAFNKFVASVKWRELEERYELDGADIILPLLTHEYFDIPEIQRKRVKRQTMELVDRCFSCCVSLPKHSQINHEVGMSKNLCSQWCHDKIFGICSFIK